MKKFNSYNELNPPPNYSYYKKRFLEKEWTKKQLATYFIKDAAFMMVQYLFTLFIVVYLVIVAWSFSQNDKFVGEFLNPLNYIGLYWSQIKFALVIALAFSFAHSTFRTMNAADADMEVDGSVDEANAYLHFQSERSGLRLKRKSKSDTER